MNYKETIDKRINELRQLRAYLTQKLVTLPVGRVRISKSKKYTQIYLKQGIKERFVKKSEWNSVRPFVQRRYLSQVIELLDAELNGLLMLRESMFEKKVWEYEKSLGTVRQMFVSSEIPTDEEYALRWKGQHWEQSNYKLEAKIHDTNKGVMVRSKSEKLIANELEKRNIPYIYEARLDLGRRVIFPDFTILNVRTREVLYWEHFGMMDTGDYRKEVEQKIEDYERAGLGQALIMTMEEKDRPISADAIGAIIEKYCL